MTTPPQPGAAPTVRDDGELAPGTSLHGGRYVVRRVIGRGGFGVTYGADDNRLQRPVAIKAHSSTDPVERERFLREAAVLAGFSHPGVVRVYEVFEDGEAAYLVMELLDGRTLAELAAERTGPFPESEVLALAARCGAALDIVHRAGVLHRDLNPANVMVTDAGRVVLIDFGLARKFAAERTEVMTRAVTPGYAPPEQYRGEARFGPATDVYGLAATLYRLLTGRPPLAAVEHATGEPLVAPHRIEPDVSRLVSDAVLDGLELDASHRPQTVAAFLSRLGLDPDEVLDPTAARTVGADDDGDVDRTVVVDDLVSSPVDAVSEPAPWRAEPPASPGVWKVGVPIALMVAAVGSAAPILAVPVLALLVLPALATAGDALVFTRLRREGTRLRWVHRAALSALIPARFARNMVTVVSRGLPALLLGAVVVTVTLLVDTAGGGVETREGILRPGGALVALLFTSTVLRDRQRFRAAVVIDLMVGRLLGDDGRVTPSGRGLWVVAVLLAAVGFGLRPDLWPLTD